MENEMELGLCGGLSGVELYLPSYDALSWVQPLTLNPRWVCIEG